MALKKSDFEPGQTVFANWPKIEGRSVIITLIKYIPNHEWYAEFKEPNYWRD